MKKLIVAFVICGAFVAIASASPVACIPDTTHFAAGITGSDCSLPSIEGNTPVSDPYSFVANGGAVYIYDAGYAASATNTLQYDGMDLFTNKTTAPGTEKYLGTFAAGTIINFDIITTNEGGHEYKTGLGSGNPDGQVHVDVAPWVANAGIDANGYLFGFEDGYNGFDHDFNDLMAVIVGATPQNDYVPPPGPSVPEPATAFLYLAGGAIFAPFLLRKKLLRN